MSIEQRDFYYIHNATTIQELVGELNFIFNRIADRLDAIENLRPSGTTNIYVKKIIETFTQADLTSGVYTFNHALGRVKAIIQVYNESNEQMAPDNITLTDINNAAIDVTSWGDITGKTFTAIAIG